MRYFLTAIGVGALLAILAGVPGCAESITFVTDFGFNGRHAYYYVALERGYYRQAGLDVSFVRGSGSVDAIRKVGAGAAQIGFADAGSLVLARANDGIPVRMVAVVYAAPPHAIYATEDSGIRKPQDLVGHRIADSAGSANTILFGAYAKAAGFDPSKVTWQAAESSALPTLLATGRAEAIGQFTVGQPLLAAAIAPKTLVRLAYRDVGLDYYGNGTGESGEGTNAESIPYFFAAQGISDSHRAKSWATTQSIRFVPCVPRGPCAVSEAAETIHPIALSWKRRAVDNVDLYL